MKVYGNREFQGLKVGVLSKESQSFLSRSKNEAEKHEKGQLLLPYVMVKFYYIILPSSTSPAARRSCRPRSGAVPSTPSHRR